jgi:SMODS and SLOG-associating 2TM effector domain 1
VIFWPEHHWIVALEILALLTAWGLLRVNRRERWQEKYLNDRYLAEWLRRAQFEVLLSPASQSNSTFATRNTSDLCIATPAVRQVELYHGPETWFVDTFQQVIDRAARQIHCDGTAAVAAIPLPTLRDALLEAWIEPQAEWHATKARKQHQKAKLGHRMTFGLFAATLLFASTHLLFGHKLQGPLGDSVTLLAIVLPAAAATLHSIERFFHHERTADRSEQMARQLRRLADRVRASETEDELRQAVREVDALMAREVEEWWIAGNLHRPSHPV